MLPGQDSVPLLPHSHSPAMVIPGLAMVSRGILWIDHLHGLLGSLRPIEPV